MRACVRKEAVSSRMGRMGKKERKRDKAKRATRTYRTATKNKKAKSKKQEPNNSKQLNKRCISLNWHTPPFFFTAHACYYATALTPSFFFFLSLLVQWSGGRGVEEI